MLSLILLFLNLCHDTVGGPVQASIWSEGDEAMMPMEDGPGPLSYRLPMFQDAQQPLVPKKLFQPTVTHTGLFPAGLTGLLIPPKRRDDAVQQKVEVAVEARCGAHTVSVRIDRLRLQAGAAPSRFRIGSCQSHAVSFQFVYFQFGLLECGGQVQVIDGQLVYTYLLSYTPPPQGFVIRVAPIHLPIHCHYNRFHYSYKIGFRPQVQHKTFLRSIKSKLSFSLTVCNAQWEPFPPGHTFHLGEQIYFLAQAGTLIGERLNVDSCYATNSEDPDGFPKVDIITNYGCMVDSRREGSSSQFVSAGENVVKFSVDAFLFEGDPQVQYLHCTLSVGLHTSENTKSCNYNRAVARWEELTASHSVCSCCDFVCNDMEASFKNQVRSAKWLVEQDKKKLSIGNNLLQTESKDILNHTKTTEETKENQRHIQRSSMIISAIESKEEKPTYINEKMEKKQDKKLKVTGKENGNIRVVTTYDIMSDESGQQNDSGEVSEKFPHFKIYSAINQDYTDVSISIPPKNYNVCCRAANGASQKDYSFDDKYGSTDLLKTVNIDNRSSIIQLEHLVNGSFDQETLPFANVRNLETGKSNSNISDTTFWSNEKQIKCINKSINDKPQNILVRVANTVNIKGSDEDDDLQDRLLQYDQKSHQPLLKNTMCNGESEFDSQPRGEAMYKTNSKEVDFSVDSRSIGIFGPAISSDKTNEQNPSHDDVGSVTFLQSTENHHLTDGRWAKMIPEWVLEHLNFLKKPPKFFSNER